MGIASRIEELGPGALADAELLAILIGGANPDEAQEAARLLLSEGLAALRSVRAMARPIAGMPKRHPAWRILAALELGRRVALAEVPERLRLLHAGDLAAVLRPRLAHLAHEEFWAVLLTARLEEIRTVRICTGGITHCSLLPREAFAPVLIHAAPCVAFAHNHPSGDARPSPDDKRVQKLLEDSGRALGIHVVDQLVITSRGHHSAREGFLSFRGEPAECPGDEPEAEHDSFLIHLKEDDLVCPKQP